jgi:hypothetical protein
VVFKDALGYVSKKLGFNVGTDQPFNATQRWTSLTDPQRVVGRVVR